MAIGAPFVGTTQIATSGATSVTLDFTGATVGEWCFAVVGLSDSQVSAPTAPTGWTILLQGSESASGAASSRLIVYTRLKQAGDTTQAFTWGTACGYAAVPLSWPGLDPTTPTEGVVYLAHSSGTTYPTTSITPTAADRWITGAFYDRTTTSTGTWTPDAAMTERVDFSSAANPWSIVEVADTNAAVSQAAHTYTSTCTVTSSHGGSIAFALIPAATGAAVTFVPQRYGQAAPTSIVPWAQRGLCDANTVATAANPLAAPLDSAWQAGGRYSHLYADTATRDRRAYVYQRAYISPPGLLATAELENELLGGAGTPPRYAVPASHVPRWWMPQQRAYVSNPALLSTAELENELLGGADAARRYNTPASHAPRWWMPRQPKREGTSPGLLDSAELEGPLLAGDTRRHYAAADYWDRREVAQQRAYISDPSFYPTGAVTDPLTLAWGDGGNYWTLYNTPALQVDRREVPAQRRYVSDPLLLATAELENELLGGADTARHYLAAAFTDRRQTVLQRIYWGPPTTALLENELLGSADDLARRYRQPWSDRRQIVGWQPRWPDPNLLATPGIDPLTVAAGVGGDLWRRSTTPATHVDRRETAAQSPRWTLYFDAGPGTPPLTLAWGAGGDLWHRYNRPSRQRNTWPAQIIFTLFGVICETPRPSTGTTSRPGSGTIVYALATTARPGTGTTTRPFTGVTDDPC